MGIPILSISATSALPLLRCAPPSKFSGKLTDGSVRPLGGSLDLNGVGKRWALQAAADLLVHPGVHTFCFNAGGDIAVRGAPHGQDSWRVAIPSPWGVAWAVENGADAVLAFTDGDSEKSCPGSAGVSHVFQGQRIAAVIALPNLDNAHHPVVFVVQDVAVVHRLASEVLERDAHPHAPERGHVDDVSPHR